MKVYVVEWGDTEYPRREVFGTRELAEASRGEWEVEEVDVRDTPLGTETRYYLGVGWNDVANCHQISILESRVVHELEEDYGKGLVVGYRGYDAHGPDRAAVLAAIHEKWDKKIAGEVKRERERLDYLARCTHQFVCPDHGPLGKATPTSAMPCRACHRMVDADGNRFGVYMATSVASPDHGATFVYTNTIMVGGPQLAKDGDEGPLPQEEVERRELEARSEQLVSITPGGSGISGRTYFED